MNAEEKLKFLSHVYVEGNANFLGMKPKGKTLMEYATGLKSEDPVLDVYVFYGKSEEMEKKMPFDVRANGLLRRTYLKQYADEWFSIPAGSINWHNFPEVFQLTDCTIGNLSAFRTCCKWEGFVFHPRDEEHAKQLLHWDADIPKRDYLANMIIQNISTYVSQGLLDVLKKDAGISEDKDLDCPRPEMEEDVER